jgi:hypothetical protein
MQTLCIAYFLIQDSEGEQMKKLLILSALASGISLACTLYVQGQDSSGICDLAGLDALLADTYIDDGKVQASLKACLKPLAQAPSADAAGALSLFARAFNYINQSVGTHINLTTFDNKPYCQDNASQEPLLRLANFEIQLAAIEENVGTFCCSADECAANCPTPANLYSDTCDDQCKPHPPALLTTLDAGPRIQNVAKRLLAVMPKATFLAVGSSCQAPSGQDQTLSTGETTQGSTHTTSTTNNSGENI